MSVIKFSPEFMSTIREGHFKVVAGGAPRDAKVVDVRIEGGGSSPWTILVEVDDGLEGERVIEFQTVPSP